MNPFRKAPKKPGHAVEGLESGPEIVLSPLRVRLMGVVKLVSSVGVCLSLLINGSVSFGLLILPLVFSFMFIPEITSGKVFSQTSARERGVPILLVVSFLLVLIIVSFVWVGAEAKKTGTSKDNPAAIPQQSTQ